MGTSGYVGGTYGMGDFCVTQLKVFIINICEPKIASQCEKPPHCLDHSHIYIQHSCAQQGSPYSSVILVRKQEDLLVTTNLSGF